MAKNPFGDDDLGAPFRSNPFGDDQGEDLDPVTRLEHAARKIRSLRRQLGAEGLPASAMRELIDELSGALDAAASALKRAGQ